jgi:transporter family-2 protein
MAAFMTWLLLLMALLAGFAFPFQAGINAHLKLWLGHPILAAFMSFLVGTLLLLIFPLILSIPPPPLSTLRQIPWWGWAGGILGAFSITSSIVLAPKLGAAVMLATIVAGQMIASLVLDHYGLIGFRILPVGPWRLLGVVLVVTGVWLIQRN